MWFYGLSKNWEPWIKAFLVSQNWHLTLREPNHLSVLQTALLEQQWDTGCLPATFGEAKDLAPVTWTHSSTFSPYLALKIAASVADYFRMKTDLCGPIYIYLNISLSISWTYKNITALQWIILRNFKTLEWRKQTKPYYQAGSEITKHKIS